MEATSVYTTTVLFNDPIAACAGRGLAANTLLELREQYEGRCYQGAFVLRVTEVLAVSDVRIEKTNARARGVVDVQWRARVRVFVRGDLALIRIVHLAPAIIGQDGPLVVSLIVRGSGGRSLARSLAVGQAVPVRLLAVSHNPKQQHVTAAGELLTCDREAPVVSVRGRLGPDAVELVPLLEALEEPATAPPTAPAPPTATSAFFFEKLLRTREDPAGPGTLDLVEFVKKALVTAQPCEGDWSRPLELPRNSPLVNFVPRQKAGAAATANTAAGVGAPRPAREAIFALLKEILSWREIVQRLSTEFPTEEKIRQQMPVWLQLREAQQREARPQAGAPQAPGAPQAGV